MKNIINHCFLRGIPLLILILFKSGYSTDPNQASQPNEIVKIGSCKIPGKATCLKLDGDYCFMGAGESGLQIVDISDSENPKLIGGIGLSGSSFSLAKRNNAIFVISAYGGFNAVDVSNPHKPALIGGIPNGAYYDFAVQDSIAYLTGPRGLQIINISNPRKLNLISEYTDIGQFLAIALLRNYVYVSAFNLGKNDCNFGIIDISNPAKPNLVATKNFYNRGRNIFIDDDYLYIPTASDSLSIFNISDPTNPVLISKFDLYLWAVTLYAKDGFVYTGWKGYGRQGIQIVDCRSPESPVSFSRYELSNIANDFVVRNGLLYAAVDTQGCMIFKVQSDK
jgi:hypothetical protein